MVTIRVVGRAGTQGQIEGREGMTLMEVIRDSGIEEQWAICGGCCSCGTCHVFIDAQYAAQLPPMGHEERDLLESSSYLSEASRLACQVRCTAGLDGLRLTIAPAE